MRLTHYLTEEQNVQYIWSLLQKDCKPYIKQLKNDLLYRGSYKSNDGIIKVIPRKDRRPMSIYPKVQEILDNFFNKKFGWKPRSTGVFCTGDFEQAGQYGITYSFWPIGPFKFLWHPTVSDLFGALWTDNHSSWSYWIDNPQRLEGFVKGYSDKNFHRAIQSKHEIMISCKKYYLVLDGYDGELIDNMSSGEQNSTRAKARLQVGEDKIKKLDWTQPF